MTRLLALMWLLDAALQYQPYMFSTDFPGETIEPSGQGSPTWVQAPVSFAAHLMAAHPVPWNVIFATTQLLIACGLFWRRTVKLALAGSIMWAVAVWWLGEGLGGLLAGPASPLMGLPGAVILYALIAILVWPRDTIGAASVATASPLRATGSRSAWLVLWGTFAAETLRPANRAPTALRDMLAGMASGEPAWIRSIDDGAARLLDNRGALTSAILAAVFTLIALAILHPPLTRPILLATIVVALLIWVVAQDLGQIATGRATDPNTGPLLALLALCYWPITRPAGSGPHAEHGHQPDAHVRAQNPATASRALGSGCRLGGRARRIDEDLGVRLRVGEGVEGGVDAG